MSSKFRTTLIASLVTLLVAVPAAVWAGHTFNDVPTNNIFHDDITWLADAGVTKGCNPPDNTEFCPDDNVTREQMAAFMRRLAEKRVVDADTVDGQQAADLADADTVDGQHASDLALREHGHATPYGVATYGPVRTISSTSWEDVEGLSTDRVTVPRGHTGILFVRFAAESLCQTSSGGQNCSVQIVLSGNGVSPTALRPNSNPIFDNDLAGSGYETQMIQRASGGLAPGTYTVTVQAKVDHTDVTFHLANSALMVDVKLDV